MKEHKISLSDSELTHIEVLIERNKEDGSYYGNKNQYLVRTARIEEKIMKVKYCNNEDPEAMCPGCDCWKQTRKLSS